MNEYPYRSGKNRNKKGELEGGVVGIEKFFMRSNYNWNKDMWFHVSFYMLSLSSRIGKQV